MKIEKKVARICNNDHNWKYPSRKEIKSSNANTYENKYGFGHEEWLLDTERLINGYHYAFLQPINNALTKHEGKRYQIHLYFVTSGKKHLKGYIGYIDNVECLRKNQAEECLDFYQKHGWIEEMKRQVREIHGNTEIFDKEIATDARKIFNVRFKPEDVHVSNSNFKQISENDVNTRSYRYVLVNYVEDFNFEKTAHSQPKGKNNISTDTHFRTVEAYVIEVSARHRIIQKGVKRELEKTGLYLPIPYEVENKDLYAERKDGTREIYEIKTYKPKQCIREALGQLLEYNHYPARHSSDVLYIVGSESLDNEDKQYLNFLRKTYNLPVWYRQYDIGRRRLLDKE